MKNIELIHYWCNIRQTYTYTNESISLLMCLGMCSHRKKSMYMIMSMPLYLQAYVQRIWCKHVLTYIINNGIHYNRFKRFLFLRKIIIIIKTTKLLSESSLVKNRFRRNNKIEITN